MMSSKRYVVKSGDTLWGIAANYGLDVETLAGYNNIENRNLLQIGQIVWIPDGNGLDSETAMPPPNSSENQVYVVQVGDNLSQIAFNYRVTLDALVRANGLKNPNFIRVGQVLVIPQTEKTARPSVTPSDSEKLERLLPVAGRVTQWWGENPYSSLGYGEAGHNGIDFGCMVGTPVVAMAAGRVTQALEAKTGYGVRVRIAHNDGVYVSLYAHLSKLLVRNGEMVTRGQTIGLSGNTGNSTGPHLHFGLYRYGIAINPREWLGI